MKRLISKVCLSLLWIVAIFLGALTALFGIPQASSWVTTNISSLGDMFKLYEDLFANASWLPKSLSANLWGVVFACALILVLLFISIIPAVIVWHKKPMKGAKALDLKASKENSETSFVDAKGNFGHVVIKGDIPSPLTKYSEKLSDKQLDMEFDWHNYVGHTPVVRIVIGVVLTIVAVLFLVVRFASYLPDGALKSINDIAFVSSMNTSLDSLMNSMFGTLAGKTAFGGLSAMQLLDFVFWILLLWAGVFILLLISTFFAWIFRKGGAVKRAEKARKQYLEALSRGEFDGKFLPSASLALGVTVPENRDPDAEPKDIEGLGTGIVEISPVEGKYEGNVTDDSVTSVSLSTFNNDVLILGKPLFQSLADIKEDESKPVYEGIEYYADGQGHILPLAVEKSIEEEKATVAEEKNTSISTEVKEPTVEAYVTVVYEPRPSDRLPEYWFKKALEKSNLPSDQKPEYWYDKNKVEEPVEEHPVEEQPVEETKEDVEEEKPIIAPVESQSKVEEDDLDRRIINALEPSNLTPINEGKKEENVETISEEKNVVSSVEAEPVEEEPVEKEIRPSDREPEYWYEKNATVVEEVITKEIRPSDREPWYWYGEEPRKEEEDLSALAQENPEPIEKGVVTPAVANEEKKFEDDFDRRVLNALNPSNLTPLKEEEAEVEVEPEEETKPIEQSADRPSDKEPEYWYDRNKVEDAPKTSEDDFDRRVLNALNPDNLNPLEEEKAEEVVSEPVEEKPIVWPTDRPSDKEPEYWYEKNKVEEVPAEERPSDKEPEYWYEKNKVEEAPVSEESVEEQPIVCPTDRASDKEPEYWYDRNKVEEAEKTSEDDFDRRVFNALNPDNLNPVEEEKSEEVVSEPVEEKPFVWPTDRASDKEPEYWYDRNKVKEQEVITEAPVEEEPKVAENDFDRRIFNALNPNNLTPLEEEKPEPIKEEPGEEQPIVWPTDRASDKEPEYWYDRNKVEEAPVIEETAQENEPVKEEPAQEKPVEEQPIVWPADRPSDKEPEYWYDRNKVEEAPVSEETAQENEPVKEEFVEEKLVEEEAKEPEEIIVWPTDRASDKETEFWYHLAKIESERRPSDEEPSYWYGRNEIKKRPVVKPVGIAFTPKERGNAPKPTLIQPIRPVKEEPAPEQPVEEQKPVGPVALASHKIHEAPKIKINPVEARLVKFQLKKVQGNYKGELTPEEAFANALTNQAIVVNPVLQGQGSESGSKYLANMANREKNQMRRTGYVSAVSVNLADKKEATANKPVFNKPVSEFKSIREWSQAKKKFEEEQKALAKEAPVKNETALPKKPIDVIKPIKRPVEPVNEEKKPEPKAVTPMAPIRPVVPPRGGFNRPKAPIKPIKPIDINKKGE